MVNFNKVYQVVCKMWNVKCENARLVQNCKRLHNVSNLDIIWFIIETPELFSSLPFNKFFIFFGRKSLFHSFAALVYYTFLPK